LAVLLFAFRAGNAQTPRPTPSPAQASEAKVKLWFEFEQLTLAARYHFIELANHHISANNVQYQFIARFRFKFDPKGRYSVVANAATGSAFNGGWNATGWGTGSTQRDLHFKQLYFDAKPTKGVEMQAGGLFINYGLSTEATTYDNDSYIMGERLVLRMPKKLYFDEVSVTYASLADFNTPNVFRRFRHFDDQNYHQFLVRKQINKTIGFSADYTFESGKDTYHQAVKISLPKRNILDTLLFEDYERIDPDKSYGFNAFGEKALYKWLTLSGGFTNLNLNNFSGDRFPPGKRIYMNTTFKMSPEFSFSTQVTQGVGDIAPTIPRTRVDVILTYNILETLKRSRFF
jgi:hypothetical protein